MDASPTPCSSGSTPRDPWLRDRASCIRQTGRIVRLPHQETAARGGPQRIVRRTVARMRRKPRATARAAAQPPRRLPGSGEPNSGAVPACCCGGKGIPSLLVQRRTRTDNALIGRSDHYDVGGRLMRSLQRGYNGQDRRPCSTSSTSPGRRRIHSGRDVACARSADREPHQTWASTAGEATGCQRARRNAEAVRGRIAVDCASS